MGIFCEIQLHKPEDGAFRPGTLVAGFIKYAVDEESRIDNLSIAMKGGGRLHIREWVLQSQHMGSTVGKQTRHNRVEVNHINTEKYFDIETVVAEQITLQSGMYTTCFYFILPKNIPPTFSFSKHRGTDEIKCSIKYYIRIKFNRPGFLKFAKRFKKEIKVVSGIIPQLPTEPTVFGKKKVLTQLFTRKEQIVDTKVTIQTSVIPTGSKIDLYCEVSNYSNKDVKAIVTKLKEYYTFVKPRGMGNVKLDSSVQDTSFKTVSIKNGNTQAFDFQINLPSDATTLEHSNIVSRNYFVKIEICLPFPHRNVVLECPVQIGDNVNEVNYNNITLAPHYANPENINVVVNMENFDAPPTYWETMNELSNEDEYLEEK